jgi:hypothetical protein
VTASAWEGPKGTDAQTFSFEKNTTQHRLVLTPSEFLLLMLLSSTLKEIYQNLFFKQPVSRDVFKEV